MATRREVREAFYSELDSAAAGYNVTVTQEQPNLEEDLPALKHNDLYREVTLNRGNAPTSVTTDADGVQEYTYSSQMEAQFTLTIVTADEQVKEDLYEQVRSYFEAYTHPIKDASDLQTDAYRIEVGDSEPNDMLERSPRARADTLTVNVFFERMFTEDVDPTTDVVQNVDSDNDGTIDNTYTTIQ